MQVEKVIGDFNGGITISGERKKVMSQGVVNRRPSQNRDFTPTDIISRHLILMALR
jgi:hypothetical protein